MRRTSIETHGVTRAATRARRITAGHARAGAPLPPHAAAGANAFSIGSRFAVAHGIVQVIEALAAPSRLHQNQRRSAHQGSATRGKNPILAPYHDSDLQRHLLRTCQRRRVLPREKVR